MYVLSSLANSVCVFIIPSDKPPTGKVSSSFLTLNSSAPYSPCYYSAPSFLKHHTPTFIRNVTLVYCCRRSANFETHQSGQKYALQFSNEYNTAEFLAHLILFNYCDLLGW
uniref:Uncharacterized protein n=1 Tax=Physcomitrium patens TaxID=3218 RepID=A0A2K1K002_PHYPA|nr:hypothetical protein PHYPA_014229 [Physcomitrium patens]